MDGRSKTRAVACMEQAEDSSRNHETSGGNTETLKTQTREKPRFVGLYREDVVQSALHPGVLGIVTKVAGDSDSDSSSDSDDEDDNVEVISNGFARICWTDLRESTEKIEGIQVVDRAFLHGAIVAAIASPLGQTGVVVNVELKVDLKLPSGVISRDVDSRKIRRIRGFVVGDYVIHDQWLGRVEEVVDNVIVMFDDGSKCKLYRADPERLLPVSESPMDDSDCPYYPGQRVKGNSPALFKAARWLKGSWKASKIEGTVTDVEVGCVVVYWIAAAHTGNFAQSTAIPSEQQDPKCLKRMKDFSYTTWQLGDRALLPQRLTKKCLANLLTPVEVTQSECETEVVENFGQVLTSGSSDAGSNSVPGIKDSAPDSWVAYRRKLRRRFSRREKKTTQKDDFVESAVSIASTKTKVDVQWQDGQLEQALDACTLFPVDHLGDHDFWPEQHVMERSSDFEGSDLEARRVGIVKSVDSKQRVATVRWLQPMEHPEASRQFESEEVVSVYELIEHPDYMYCLGDVVIRLCSASDSAADARNALMLDVSETVKCKSEERQKPFSPSVSTFENKEMEKEKDAGKAKLTDLSWVGMIIGLHDGEIEVAWADGEVTKVGPQAIFVVGRDEDDGSSQSSGIEDAEEADDGGSWTTVDSSELNEVETEQECESSGSDENTTIEEHNQDCSNARQLSGGSHEGEGPTNGLLQSGDYGFGRALSLPFTALIKALKFAAGLLWTLQLSKRDTGSAENFSVTGYDNQCAHKCCIKKESDEGRCSEHMPASNQDCQQENVVDQSSLKRQPTSSVSTGATTPAGISEGHSGECMPLCTDVLSKPADILQVHSHREEVENTVLELESRGVSVSSIFKRFDSVKDATDHHFAKETDQPSSQRRWSKKIQIEWVILEKNLPDTIYVRVYEDRMDLIRAAIVGAAGTPYHDGLFFFDFYLPPEYPSVPPLAHYHSGGMRLNPNLYETGKVCLSLLNTWTGKGNEIWHPPTSSILQVLVSIQGLVLNARPYFNEAGYDRQIGTAEGEKNCLAYGENAFLLSCKSMLHHIRKPPQHYEEFVREHFKQRGPYILQACNAYMQGSPVGSLSEDALVSLQHSVSTEQTSSIGFRLMIAKLMPRLTVAFSSNGANCEH